METRKIKIIIIFTLTFFVLAGIFTYLMFFSGGKSDSGDELKNGDPEKMLEQGGQPEFAPEPEGLTEKDIAEMQKPSVKQENQEQPEFAPEPEGVLPEDINIKDPEDMDQ